MNTYKIIVAVVALASLASLVSLTACVETKNQKLEQLAEQLDRTAQECVYAVRDRHVHYDDSGSCRMLNGMSMSYISAGGGGLDEDTRHYRLFTQARMHAWMAVALSNGQRKGDPVDRIW
jgi:hypothetical protein